MGRVGEITLGRIFIARRRRLSADGPSADSSELCNLRGNEAFSA
jgi:hypothetical protein